MRAGRIFEAALYVSDLDAAERFYSRVFGLECVSRMGDRGRAFRCGYGVLLVFNAARTRIRDRAVPAHGCEGAGHVAFEVDEAELTLWRDHLREHGIEIETEIAWDEGGRSIYVRDPGGNSIELATPTLWGFNQRPWRPEREST